MNRYRRGLIVVIIVLCTIIIGRIIEDKKIYGSNQLVEALSVTTFKIECAELNLSGEYMPKYMTKDEMKVVVEMVAQYLGIENYEESFEEIEDRVTFTIDKKASAAHTHIQLVEKTEHLDQGTFIARNYLTVNIKLSNQCNSIGYFENQLSKLYEDLEIQPSKGLIVTATQQGIVSEQEAKDVMLDIIQALNGEIREIYMDDEYHSAYGYSKFMKDFVISKGEKVNMDLAVTYNEEENTTYLYAATPVITSEY